MFKEQFVLIQPSELKLKQIIFHSSNFWFKQIEMQRSSLDYSA